MLGRIVLLLVMMGMYSEASYAGNTYYYKGVCPGGKIVEKCKDKNHDGKPDFPCEYWTDKLGGYFVDVWGFAECNCTSYVADKLRDPFGTEGHDYDPVYGVDFRNSYLQPPKNAWSHGGRWGQAAKRAGIAVDMTPLPGDAVYFGGGTYGHIARVEWVRYDDNMNWRKFKLSEYNYKKESYTERIITREMARTSKHWTDKPKGFIHVLATKNPEFYFNYYDLGYDFAGQTKEEWEYIYALVMKKYYKGNDSKYTSAFQGVWADIGGELPVGFGGAGGSYTPPTGNYTSNGTGATEHSQPGEWEHPGYKHGVSMDETEMSRSGSGDYNRKWTFVHGEVPVVNVRVRLKNKTNHKIHHNDVTIKWFESPNHTFNPQYDHHFATDHNKKRALVTD